MSSWSGHQNDWRSQLGLFHSCLTHDLWKSSFRTSPRQFGHELAAGGEWMALWLLALKGKQSYVSSKGLPDPPTSIPYCLFSFMERPVRRFEWQGLIVFSLIRDPYLSGAEVWLRLGGLSRVPKKGFPEIDFRTMLNLGVA